MKATLTLGGVGLIPFGLIITLGPWIFSFVFGEEWITAGKYVQWIGVFLFFEFVNKPVVKSLLVLSAQKFHLYFTILFLLVRITALFIGYYIFDSDSTAIALFSMSSAIMYIILILIVLQMSKKYDMSLKKE